jgi:thiamine-monophosphate kinase
MTSRRSERRPGEFELISRYFSPLAKTRGALRLLDDVALFRVPARRELVVTADAIVEGVHFLRDDPPASIAQKALRVNLSDLAAKGARPAGYLVCLALPADRSARWLGEFAGGLARDQRRFAISLLGGDTSKTPGPLTIAIAALGTVQRGKLISRGGARAGDLVFVSGAIGDAGAGLEMLKSRGSGKGPLVRRYRLPTPRLSLGMKLVGIASAAIDVSDGLIADLGHVARVSGVHIAVAAAQVPLSHAFRKQFGTGERAVLRAATSGDDYEIAFTCPRSKAAKLASIARSSGIAVTEIGSVMKGSGVTLRGADGRALRLARAGYTHF